jgi:glycerophosphoryl diester phosphodiesterase
MFINSICLFINFSYDGKPFVFHDSTFRRTTNIASVFPKYVDKSVSFFNISEIKQLNAGSWFLEVSHRVIWAVLVV